jgi:RPA family protein
VIFGFDSSHAVLITLMLFHACGYIRRWMSREKPTYRAEAETLFELLHGFSADDIPRPKVTALQSRLKELHRGSDKKLEDAKKALLAEVLSETGYTPQDIRHDVSSRVLDKLNVNNPGGEKWTTVTAAVVTAIEGKPGHIGQQLLLSDQTGTLPLVTRASCNPPRFEPGRIYTFENVITKAETEYAPYRLVFNRASSARHVQNKLSLLPSQQQFTGWVTGVTYPSGVFPICSAENCRNPVLNGDCSQHGFVRDPMLTRRAKLIVDSFDPWGRRHVSLDPERVQTLTDSVNDELISKLQNQSAHPSPFDIKWTDLVSELVGTHVRLSGHRGVGVFHASSLSRTGGSEQPSASRPPNEWINYPSVPVTIGELVGSDLTIDEHPTYHWVNDTARPLPPEPCNAKPDQVSAVVVLPTGAAVHSVHIAGELNSLRETGHQVTLMVNDETGEIPVHVNKRTASEQAKYVKQLSKGDCVYVRGLVAPMDNTPASILCKSVGKVTGAEYNDWQVTISNCLRARVEGWNPRTDVVDRAAAAHYNPDISSYNKSSLTQTQIGD